jgi:hypothetical protein
MATKKTKKTARVKKQRVVYTITERTYEWNDEYSFTPEYGGGHVVCAYSKFENAEKELQRRTEASYEECNPTEYMPPGEDIAEDVLDGLRLIGGELNNIKDVDDLNTLWDDLPVSLRIAAWKVIDGSYNSFFEIIKTEVDA